MEGLEFDLTSRVGKKKGFFKQDCIIFPFVHHWTSVRLAIYLATTPWGIDVEFSKAEKMLLRKIFIAQ